MLQSKLDRRRRRELQLAQRDDMAAAAAVGSPIAADIESPVLARHAVLVVVG